MYQQILRTMNSETTTFKLALSVGDQQETGEYTIGGCNYKLRFPHGEERGLFREGGLITKFHFQRRGVIRDGVNREWGLNRTW